MAENLKYPINTKKEETQNEPKVCLLKKSLPYTNTEIKLLTK